ncbi:hypothetical protein ACJ73_03799 [Blastomyces percursus]|uniref:Choline/ethanolaminephosphotransferase 1 n=1 Tax=Blastomyces percursus TaxID=1658174 RepID=A0A1J9R8L6_9EURO|nr:hypothetical protein ACJ73_03799 [Blastomyces percursus]
MYRRRTGQSGPLGELFDHGVDACNTALEVLIFAGATNLGQSWLTVLTLFGSALTFYVQTWDEYYTQTLTLGIISGPVEGILTLCAVYATTAIKGGASFWHKPMLATLGVPASVLSILPASVSNLPFTSWYIIYGAVVLLFSTLTSILNVMHIRRRRNLNVYKPLLGLFPAVATWLLVTFDVITTICDYMDIWCLTIKHPYVEGAEAEPAKVIKTTVVDTNDNHSAACHEIES